MNLPSFHALLSPSGQSALASAAEFEPTEESFLSCLAKLQKKYPAELATAALETVILRRKARAKFSRADAMYFTRAGLEMASGETISRYRAQRFAPPSASSGQALRHASRQGKPFARVADLCCGIGGDAIGLAHGVLAVDIDALHLALAAANLAAYDLRADLIEADLTRTPPPPADALWFDPARRAQGRRVFSVRGYQPPLDVIREWMKSAPALGAKISPGVKLSELADYDCEMEFISENGDLKECALWFGPLKTATRRATLLSSHSSPISLTAPPPHSHTPAPATSSPMNYLYEPDPAVMRAGLVADLAAQIGAHQLDADIAYLTSNSLTPTPFARPFAIEADMPFSQKRLREKLRAMNVGRVTVKKRGSPLDPDEFARSLRLKGGEERILFLTHVQGKAWILIGRAVR